MKKILIVEDDPHHLALLEIILSKQGYITIKASNGKEGLNLLKTESPDLIIADVMMPEMDGYEFCRKVREQKEYKNLPFIFLSALGDVENKVKGLKLGADDYIAKPFDREELLARIEILLDRYERYKKTIETPVTKGRFEDIPITDLLQLLHYGNRTATIRIKRNGDTATVWVKEGKIIDAQTGRRRGMDALYTILSWDKGEFEMEQSVEEKVVETIHTGADETILEVLRQRDEAERMKEKWNPESVIVIKKIPEDDELKLVIKREGEEKIKNILEQSPFSEYRTLLLLEELEKEGNIEIKGKGKETRGKKVINIMVIGKNTAERNLFIKNAAKTPYFSGEGDVNFAKIHYEDSVVNLYGLPGLKRFAPLWEAFAKKCDGLVILVNPSDTESTQVGVFAYHFLKNKIKDPMVMINTNPMVKFDKEGIQIEVCLPSDVRKASSIIEEMIKKISLNGTKKA